MSSVQQYLRFALFAGIGLGLTASARAVEPAQEFLDELLAREYFDYAIEYIDRAKTSPAVPVTFKKTLQYQRGKALMAGARAQRDQALREKELNEAHQTFSAFLAEQPDSIFSLDCRSQMGNVVVERARMRMEKAKKQTDKAAVHAEARKLYDEALKIFTDLEKEVAEELEKFPKVLDEKRDKEKVEKRDQYRKDYLQAQLLVGATKEEAAATHPAGSPEHKKYLEDAKKMYAEIYDKYRTRLAGLYARLYEARCEQKLGRHKEAAAILDNDIFSQPDAPDAFRTLKIKGTALAMESWTALNQNDKAVKKGLEVIDKARPTEEKTAEFQEMRYLTAKAIDAYLEELKKKNPKDSLIPGLKKDGNKLVTFVLRYPNEYQNDIRPLAAKFAGVKEGEATARVVPKTFDEAKQMGGDAVREMQGASSIIKTMEGQLAKATGEEKKNLVTQIAEQKTLEKTTHDDAAYYFSEAQRLITKDTNPEDVGLILYLTCFLKFSEQDYMSSVMLGEFVAKRYPASAGARQCAKIALASLLKLYGEKDIEDKSFESDHIVAIADYIVTKWPEQPEAEEALNTLIPFMIKERQLDRAQAYLDKISVDSVHRGSAELKTGQALWSSYLETSREIRNWETGEAEPPAGTDIAKKKADLEQLKTRAQKTLIDGVERMKKQGDVTPIVATAALSLAQIYVDTNQPMKSTALLEDPKIGPLTLLAAKNEIMNKPGLPEETYKTALRAYVSSLSVPTAKKEEVIPKAKGVMDSLKATIGSTEEGQKKLVGTYVGIARDLQTQMANSPPAVRSALAAGFEFFLNEVATDAKELNILNWVGETYRAMAEAFIEKKGEVPAEAVKYLDAALKTFNRILEMGDKDKAFLPGEMGTQIRLQVAKTYRQLNRPKDAVDVYEKILATRATLLPVQKDAAQTYMEWAESFARSKKPADAIPYYKSAMMGRSAANESYDQAKEECHLGLGEMAKMTSSNEKFKDAFHEARINISICRMKIANVSATKAEKDKEYNQVKADIGVLRGLYPDLGGEKWRPMYDKLMKDAQLALKEKPTGLEEFEKSATVPATTNTSATNKTP